MIERSLLRARLVKGNGGKPLKTLGFPGRECAEYVEVEEGVPVVIRLTIDRSFDWKCGSYLKVQCYPNAYEPLPAADIKHPDQRRDHNVDIEVFQLWNKAEKKWNNATFEFKELEAGREVQELPDKIRKKFGEICLSVKRCTQDRNAGEKARESFRPILPDKACNADIKYGIDVATTTALGISNPESLKPLEHTDGNWINFVFLPRSEGWFKKRRSETESVNETKGNTLVPRSVAQTIARKRPPRVEPASDFEADGPESGEDSSDTSRTRAELNKKQNRKPRRAIESIEAHISPVSTSRLPRRAQQEQEKDKNMPTVPSSRMSDASNKRRNSDGGRLFQAPTKSRKVDNNKVGQPDTSTTTGAPAGANLLATGTGGLGLDTLGAAAQLSTANDEEAHSQSSADEQTFSELQVDEEGPHESQADQEDDGVSIYEEDRRYEAQRRLRRELDRISREIAANTRMTNRLLLAQYRRAERDLEALERYQGPDQGGRQ